MLRMLCVAALLAVATQATAEPHIKIGVATVLTGDLSVMGDNIRKTIETYKKHRLRHPADFIFEDSRKSGAEGLAAYKKLIVLDHVDVLVGGSVSNGTMAAASLINQSKTVTITPLTGGTNIDQAGDYIFRIGSSDRRNAQQQAELFADRRLNRIALLTEQTEYTNDIAKHFRADFKGQIVFDEEFLPNENSFRSVIVRLLQRKPEAIFIATQTGLAFGHFMKELLQLAPLNTVEVHTNFVGACNPDAFLAAGAALDGVRYLSPAYNSDSQELRTFFEQFRNDHGSFPQIPMHTAGTVDLLDILQKYLDTTASFSREGFQQYLLNEVGEYHGLMGTFSFDQNGNSHAGFVPKILKIKFGKVQELVADEAVQIGRSL